MGALTVVDIICLLQFVGFLFYFFSCRGVKSRSLRSLVIRTSSCVDFWPRLALRTLNSMAQFFVLRRSRIDCPLTVSEAFPTSIGDWSDCQVVVLVAVMLAGQNSCIHFSFLMMLIVKWGFGNALCGARMFDN